MIWHEVARGRNISGKIAVLQKCTRKPPLSLVGPLQLQAAVALRGPLQCLSQLHLLPWGHLSPIACHQTPSQLLQVGDDVTLGDGRQIAPHSSTQRLGHDRIQGRQQPARIEVHCRCQGRGHLGQRLGDHALGLGTQSSLGRQGGLQAAMRKNALGQRLSRFGNGRPTSV